MIEFEDDHVGWRSYFFLLNSPVLIHPSAFILPNSSFISAMRSIRPYLLILPAFLLAFMVIAIPFGDIVRTATHEVSRFGILIRFNGADNLLKVFKDPLFLSSLIRTLWWTLFVVAGTNLISLPVAILLNQKFHGRTVARAIIMLPWSVSLTMMAVVWRWTFNAEYGMLNSVLQRTGIISGPIAWLAQGELAFPIEIIVGILVSIPFTTTIYMGGLSSLPEEIYEAARLEGASVSRQFFYLTLPLIRPFVNIAIVLNVIYVFSSFPIIWVLTEGGPADSTQILVTYLYKLAFKLGRIGEASAVSLVMLAILFVFTFIYLRTQEKEQNA
jgi:multiple sugar transport system permease protein